MQSFGVYDLGPVGGDLLMGKSSKLADIHIPAKPIMYGRNDTVIENLNR